MIIICKQAPSWNFFILSRIRAWDVLFQTALFQDEMTNNLVKLINHVKLKILPVSGSSLKNEILVKGSLGKRIKLSNYPQPAHNEWNNQSKQKKEPASETSRA